MLFSKKTLFISLFSFIFLLNTCDLFAADKKSGKKKRPPAVVEVELVTQGNFIDALTIVGTVHSQSRSHLAFPVSGRIWNIKKDEGDEVEQGETIAELDYITLEKELVIATINFERVSIGLRENEVKKIKAAAEIKKAVLKRKYSQLERIKKLHKQKVKSSEEKEIAYWEYMEAKAGYDEAQAEYQLAKEGNRKEDIAEALAKVDQIKTDMDQMVLKAPFTGTLSTKNLSVGEHVDPSDVVFTLEDLQNLEINSFIGDRDFQKVAEGQRVEIKLPVLGNSLIEGKVKTLVRSADEKSKAFPVVIAFENAGGKVTPGMHAEMRVINEITNAVIIPYDAVVKNLRTGETSLFTVKENVAKKVEITILAFTDKTAAISGEVQSGDFVVVTGNESLRDGSPVKIAGQDTPPDSKK